ncbi:uncharacterized protein NPIL_81351 [Nephila pilipes]|uniref:Uncharacterized protein n=1 Tax=Nephila pilipes TaxID=299642 RepID=A0A8X6UHM5_NEPPI|nr:uncharacterized protein NPIL_81351 [Nephila pilipes]
MKGGVLPLKECFAFGFLLLSTFVRAVDGAENTKEIDSYRSLTGHLHLLGECRRQLTFLASMALGAFITKVMKDSPMTPLPLPPLADTLRWNLISIPAHLPMHAHQWTLKHPQGQPVYLNQGFSGLARSLPSESWIKGLFRLRRDLPRQLRSSPELIYTAVQRTLKPLKFIIPHALGMQHWLLRWCH